jgi:hypothetical protein
MSIPRLAISLSMPQPLRFPVLREHAYRRFWYAALAHNVGGWLLFAAQGWLLLKLTDEPTIVALFLALRLGVKGLLSMPAGALSDRTGPLPVLRAARFADALPALLILAAATIGQLHVSVLLISGVLAATIHAFDQPAHRSLLHRYAPGDLLVGGVALSATASTLATLLGPVLLVLVASTAGVLWALPLQMLLAVLSGVILLGNRDPRRPAPARSGHTLGNGAWAAIRILASTPTLLALTLLAGSPGLLDRLLALATPSYASERSAGAAGLTLLFLAPAAGALLGSGLLAALNGAVERLLPLALGSGSAAVLSAILLTTTPFFLLSVALFLLLGAAKTAFSITMMAALQRRVPDHARGRLLAL